MEGISSERLACLLSFAAVTDETAAEIAAAGHDRCIIPIKPEALYISTASAPLRASATRRM